MRIIGCDLHAAQQTIAMLDGDTGEVVITAHDGPIRLSHSLLGPPGPPSSRPRDHCLSVVPSAALVEGRVVRRAVSACSSFGSWPRWRFSLRVVASGCGSRDS
jgi:hypothetical protein